MDQLLTVLGAFVGGGFGAVVGPVVASRVRRGEDTHEVRRAKVDGLRALVLDLRSGALPTGADIASDPRFVAIKSDLSAGAQLMYSSSDPTFSINIGSPGGDLLDEADRLARKWKLG